MSVHKQGIKNIERLSEVFSRPIPSSILILGYLIPFTIAYLVYVPNTRLIRIALYPFGLFVMVWVTMKAPGQPVAAVEVVMEMLLINLGSSTRYAFASSPPTHHPLPRQPRWASLRQHTAFKAVHNLINEYRHINEPPNPTLRITRSYAQSMRHHLLYMQWHLFLMDLATYAAFRMAPETIGSPNLVGGDVRQVCRDLAMTTGLPELLWWMFWTMISAMVNYQGMATIWHILSAIGIGSGLYLDEEWPKLMHKPWLSTSLNEFWGKRYHQILRDFYLLLATPFSYLPRPIHVISVFLISSLLHMTIYYPLRQQFIVGPYLSFFVGCGVGCVLERQFYHMTGKRVDGRWGMLWTWTFMLVVSVPIVEYEWSSGWTGAMRGELSRNKQFSMVEWLVWSLGFGPKPTAK
ncbi:MAG: hypothetical protein TREMPRED_002807 [Tremellales sp. Tagirdzhanova-0007]|nr:MAG: hypothetical protein TREMPRED_002807 [Tremellales sp. Tagirdzhanova-0007]